MSDYIAREGTTALGIVGTVLGGLATAGGGIGLLGGMPNHNATREDVENARILAGKDSEIALLKANAETDKKLVDVYTAAAERDKTIRNEIREEVRALEKQITTDREAQMAVNMQQAVLNGTTGATLTCLQGQIAQLQSMTALYIPSSKVTPAPMPQYNSWTAPQA